MNRKTKLIAMFFVFSLSAFAQKENKKYGELPSSSWSVFWSPSSNSFLFATGNNQDIAENIAEFGLTEENAENGNYQSYSYFLNRSKIAHRLGFEYTFKEGIKTRKMNVSYRTDFQYQGRTGTNQSFNKQNRFLYDSSFVPSMNTTVWRDSVYLTKYRATISGQSFRWNNAVLFRFNETKRLTFYTGFQFGIQVNYSRKFSMNQNDYAFLDTYVAEKQIVDREYTNTESPFFSTDTEKRISQTMAYHFGVPLGLDFRISDKRFWNHWHLFGELQFSVAAAKSVTIFNFTQNFGLRYMF